MIGQIPGVYTLNKNEYTKGAAPCLFANFLLVVCVVGLVGLTWANPDRVRLKVCFFLFAFYLLLFKKFKDYRFFLGYR